jgi:hypothetical protein
MTDNDVISYRLKNGVSLESLGLDEIAFNADLAIGFIKLTSAKQIPIFGGDIYSRTDNIIISTHDNWFCDQLQYESQYDYCLRSNSIALNIIANYKNDIDALFSIVI